MSMALDTALAINYLLVNVRTWIAFLTSALSLWKIRSSSSIHKSSPSPPPPPPHDHQSSPPPPDHHHQRSPPPKPLPRQTSAEVLVSGRLESRRRGKFRVVYLQGEDDKQLEAANSTSTGAAMIRRRSIDDIDIAETNEWEGLLKLKTTDMGWYRHQDLTLFNGNVVQLWQAPNHFNLPKPL